MDTWASPKTGLVITGLHYCVYPACLISVYISNTVCFQIAFFEEGQNVGSLSHQWGFETSGIEQLGPQ